MMSETPGFSSPAPAQEKDRFVSGVGLAGRAASTASAQLQPFPLARYQQPRRPLPANTGEGSNQRPEILLLLIQWEPQSTGAVRGWRRTLLKNDFG